MKFINKEQFLALSKDNTLILGFDSCVRRDSKISLVPVLRPRFSKRYNLHKLTLRSKDNPKGCKFYGYLRDNSDKVSFAMGDMAITVKEIEIL